MRVVGVWTLPLIPLILCRVLQKSTLIILRATSHLNRSIHRHRLVSLAAANDVKSEINRRRLRRLQHVSPLPYKAARRTIANTHSSTPHAHLARRVNNLYSHPNDICGIISGRRVNVFRAASSLCYTRLVELQANLITSRRQTLRMLDVKIDPLHTAGVKHNGSRVLWSRAHSVQRRRATNVRVIRKGVRRTLLLIDVRIRHSRAVSTNGDRRVYRWLHDGARAELALPILTDPTVVQSRNIRHTH